jgi:hypothetical protein
MSGILVGGWSFVAGAYGVSAVVFAGYVTSVLLRLRAERIRAARLSSSSR